MPFGTVSASAALALAREDSVELHVTDNGAGFPDDFTARAFERFTRAGSSQPLKGQAWVSITRAVAESLGGSAQAANKPGGGADVWIALPLWTEESRSVTAAQLEPAAAKTPS